MTGIPSVIGVYFARLGMIRVLIRAAVVASLVLVGWLLGSMTALAQESTDSPAAASPAAAPGLLTAVAAPAAVSAEVPGVDLAIAHLLATDSVTDPVTGLATDPVTGLGIPALPAQPPGPSTAPVADLNSVRELAVPPILEPVLTAVQPALADPPDRIGVTGQSDTGEDGATAQTDAAALAEPLRTEPTPAEMITDNVPMTPATPSVSTATPTTQAPQLPASAVATDRSTGATDRSTGSATVDADSTLPYQPYPLNPNGFGSATCPGGPAGAGATTQGPHAVSTSDGCVRAALTLVLHQRYLPVGDPPGSPSQQPSTSPD